MTDRTDVAVIGGGILGLATAFRLLEARPGLGVVVLEKEHELARHQTGRNSGVIHSGLYYRPGSHKAVLCRQGRTALIEYCADKAIAHEICGKVVVAVDDRERPPLDVLNERAVANGVPVERIGRDRLRELEPNVAGVDALHVPGTGIVDFVAVCDALAGDIRVAGGDVRVATRVTGVVEEASGVTVVTDHGEVRARALVNCGGLQADLLANGAGGDRIVPFRGEYHDLEGPSAELVRNLVYPVPDPAYPFLGVHVTRGVHGRRHAGPNAVLALAREGYRWRDVDLREVASLARHRGFRHFAREHWRTGAAEVARSLSRARFVASVRRLVPDVREEDLVPAPAGVRAQAMAPDGSLLDDFSFADTSRAVHLLNAPSPGATASLEIGRVVADRVFARL